MCNRRIKNGFTLISILIGLFILACGIVTLIRVYPVIMGLSEKSKNSVNVSFIADKIFTQIEIYEDKDIELPETIEGTLSEFPDYKYKLNFVEEKVDLYRVELEIFWKKEGRDEKKYFVSVLRRR
ncbi:MAG: type II secretion system protein [Candidatus Ratteibacteria bacterium]